MDSLWLTRLKSFLVDKIGPLFVHDIPSVVVWTAHFIENRLQVDLAGSEKLTLCLNWIKSILSEAGTVITDEVESLIKGFIAHICTITKGLPGAPVINAHPKVVSPLSTTLDVTPPIPAKKAKSLFGH